MKIAAVHTGLATIGIVGGIFREIAPEVELLHLMDDGVVRDAVLAGKIEPQVTRRMCNLFLSAEAASAHAILLCCSTVGETADTGRTLTRVPIVRIDEAMAEKAVAEGKHVGVVATVRSTLGPTSRLIQHKAEAAGKSIEIETVLADGALDILNAGDPARHDAMVMETIRGVAGKADVIVLAQASISRVLPLLSDMRVPVLASPRLGVEKVLAVAKGLA